MAGVLRQTTAGAALSGVRAAARVVMQLRPDPATRPLLPKPENAGAWLVKLMRPKLPSPTAAALSEDELVTQHRRATQRWIAKLQERQKELQQDYDPVGHQHSRSENYHLVLPSEGCQDDDRDLGVSCLWCAKRLLGVHPLMRTCSLL
eukprot:gnl/TRDRNA2_/TRDRNA2_139987_c0_seq1.p1 gnl/TRDRNA2_/TRDRNA2_139987_c0~~gnl/TRDRNA2_/TRDRNA2_139987_c0_seq1.p1  ORF type:complete len:148 (+),score=17.29 gnl/TRDRNA2_/TRDRNA2_139987_c0_seq1:280-723(+)